MYYNIYKNIILSGVILIVGIGGNKYHSRYNTLVLVQGSTVRLETFIIFTDPNYYSR